MKDFDIFYPSDPTMMRIRAKLKLVKFCRYFSRYNFEKLIRTLCFSQKIWGVRYKEVNLAGTLPKNCVR